MPKIEDWSLFTQSATRKASDRRRRLKKGRKKKVYFALDKLSVYTIIKVMKGRNCYARFCRHPGLEKLFNFIEAKSSFLRPMSLHLYQREPFLCRIATGSSPRVLHVGFSLLVIRLSSNAGRYFFLCMTFCRRWPVCSQINSTSSRSRSRPLLFSMPYIFYRAAGSGYSARIRKYVAEPAA